MGDLPPIQQRYLNAERAAQYMGITERELRALPGLLQCRPLKRRILWDIKDLKEYRPNLPLPSLTDGLVALIDRRLAEHPRTGFVYFIRCRELVKIGFSMKPMERLNDLQAVIPFELTMLGYVCGSVPGEWALHETFTSLKSSMGNEWFYHSPALLSAIRIVTERANV